MSPEMLGGLSILLLIALILLRVQVAVALLLIGFVGYSLLVNVDAALVQLGSTAFQTASNYSLSVMPLFILMGMFLSYSGLARDLFHSVDRWIGHLRGGMGMATIGACALFSSISGSVSATTATIGKVALPEMERYHYDQKVSTACVAAGGTLGILIPPSVTLILYGVLTMEPIGQLLIAGIVPGIAMALLFMVTVYVQIRRNPALAPLKAESAPFREKMVSLKKVWPFLLVFLVSIGGIYFGFFTPSEAGGVGAIGALLIALATKSLNWTNFLQSIMDTVRITGMLFMILIGAGVFGKFLAISKLPMQLSASVANTTISPYLILLIILLVYLILGLFMEGFAILVLTLPIVYPLIIDLGFNGVWFGIIMILVLNMGLLTPPLGLSVYVISGVAKNIPIQTIFRGVVPMLVTIIIFTAILVVFPSIVTFLPDMMYE
ncbi:TRAP transporter large permease [Alkalihalobacillus oceani]|uniref:TRAP transporter large permease n=1 Tax=Halalkalibacter oceani TaxID=1653776 RepID=UPI00203D8381|nr:TRAP transporter large permease [Halalkalibacter oceani]MCM3761427.1 TRAP transporter large permease [Halalkalibacter oceani]